MQIYLYFCTRFMQYLLFDDMTQCTEAAVQQLLPRVPAFRREQALKYHHTFGQFCCLQSWMLLQTLLAFRLSTFDFRLSTFNYFQLSTFHFQLNQFGKPSIEGASEFSISHCKTAIAVAIHDTPIGIDVESIRRVEPSLIERTMNADEQAQIAAASDPQRAFTRLWTMKEAYLKFLGTGITDDLHPALATADPARFLTTEHESYILSIYC